MVNRQSKDGDKIEVTSSPCSMHEVGDVYAGYADKDELITFCNELLEAERAGARVSLESAHTANSAPLAGLLKTIQRDEARWCAMLVRHLKVLGGIPSSEIGGFYEKAMAISELSERLVFLNRGQSWVVRKLREMLPRVRNYSLNNDLTEMLQSHEANIKLTIGFSARDL